MIKKQKFAFFFVLTSNIIIICSALTTVSGLSGIILSLIYITALWLCYLICGKIIGFLNYDTDICALSIKRLQSLNHRLDNELKWISEELEFLKKGYSQQRILTQMLWKMSRTMEFHQIFDVFIEQVTQLVSFEEYKLLFIGKTGLNMVIERQFVYPKSAEKVQAGELSFFIKNQDCCPCPEKIYCFYESDKNTFCFFNKIDKYLPVLIAKGFDNKEKLRPLLSPFYFKLKESYLFERVKVLSIRDGLTNLYKRQYFFLSLEEEIERAKNRKGLFSILLMDIDKFKSYNDKYGHIAGDCILREFSTIVLNALRQNDLVGRYGGEEFIFFLSDTDYKGAIKMAERLEDIIKNNNFIIPSGVLTITVSSGVAVYPDDAKTVTALIEKADKRLYDAKNNRKANVIQ